jgi:hypothetical protein
MRTTIDMPDELYRSVKAKAALKGLRLKDLIQRYIERGLSGPELPTIRSEPPVIRPATGRQLPLHTNTQLNEILDEEEANHLRGS